MCFFFSGVEDPKYSAYVKDLCDAQRVSFNFAASGKGSYLQLTKDLLGLPNLGARFFIRSCFDPFVAALLKAKEQNNAVVIGGNSGVGKSLFLLYLLRQRRPHQSIVFQKTDGVCLVMKVGDSAVVRYAHNVDVPDLLEDSDTLYLVDVGSTRGNAPLNVAALTIPIVSPLGLSNTLKQWRKDKSFPQAMFLPRWSACELEQCRRVTRPTPDEAASAKKFRTGPMFPFCLNPPSLTKHQLATQVEKYGPIPRCVFGPDAAVLDEFKAALAKIDLASFASQHNLTTILDENSSWIFHYDVNESKSFSIERLVIASDWVADQVAEHHTDKHSAAFKRFVTLAHEVNSFFVCFTDASFQVPFFSEAAGKLFEREAHKYHFFLLWILTYTTGISNVVAHFVFALLVLLALDLPTPQSLTSTFLLRPTPISFVLQRTLSSSEITILESVGSASQPSTAVIAASPPQTSTSQLSVTRME